DYEAAVEHAERLGARSHTAVLTARLGDALIEAGDTERGERLLREVIDSTRGRHVEALPAARLFLISWLCVSGRTAEAREQVRALREEFRLAHYVVFDSFILGAEAYIEVAEGHDERGLGIAREAMRQAEDPLVAAMAPHLCASYAVLAAAALAGLDGARHARDAARCLGAADSWLPEGHRANLLERAARARAEDRIRQALDETAFEAAYAEGDGLSPEEAVALLDPA
ncbi:AfsR family transcriptional regulator, partial [Actinospica acidiphila]